MFRSVNGSVVNTLENCVFSYGDFGTGRGDSGSGLDEELFMGSSWKVHLEGL